MDVKQIFKQALRDLKAKPVAILVVSVAYLPLLFISLLPIYSANIQLMAMVATVLLFALVFLGTYLAVAIFYHEGSSPLAAALEIPGRQPKKTMFIALIMGSIFFITGYFINQLVQSFAAAGLQNLEGNSLIIASTVVFAISSILPALVLVLLAFSAQLLYWGRLEQAGQVVEASYRLIKPRYGDAVKLYILPEIITWVIAFGLYVVSGLAVAALWAVFVALVLLQGVKAAYQAAAFNLFYLKAMEEEEEKRKAEQRAKAKGKGKGGAKKR
jgi:hypothetical protein